MMRLINITKFFVVFICISLQLFAVNNNNTGLSPSLNEQILEQYSDSLLKLCEKYNTKWKYSGKDLLSNPYYYRIFVQPTFYFSPIKQKMDLLNNTSQTSLIDSNDRILTSDSTINNFFTDLYINSPELIKTDQSDVDKQSEIRKDVVSVDKNVEISSRITPTKPVQVFEPIEVKSHKPNFWTFKQVYGLQIMQYYFSSNWYQGGTNYFSGLFTASITANYNNQSKLSFNNTITLQLGAQSVKGDTIHTIHTTTDQLRMVNQLAVKASKHWSYTATITSTTRITPAYPNNSTTPTADFMSPFETVPSIGMSYSNAFFKNKLSISCNLAPISANLKYVDRRALFARYGLTNGKHLYEYYGSNITLNFNWKLMKELTWTGRLYYFTNYHKVQTEWENTFTFTINKYLNTKLYLYPRFDDTQFDENGEHSVQFKQWLSLGFSLSL